MAVYLLVLWDGEADEDDRSEVLQTLQATAWLDPEFHRCEPRQAKQQGK